MPVMMLAVRLCLEPPARRPAHLVPEGWEAALLFIPVILLFGWLCLVA
jgi:ABC-type uncharacterized transport system permease subunit